MNEPSPRFQALPDDDLIWVLTWLGPLFIDQRAPSQHAVLGFLAPLLDSKTRSPAQFNNGAFPRPNQFNLEEVRRVVFSAGDLAALAPGMCFRNRRVIQTKKELLKEEGFTLNFDQQQCDALSDISGLNSRTTLLGNRWNEASPGACVRLQTRSGVSVLTPIGEVLRWSYGSSSRLIQATLSGEVSAAVEEVKQAATLLSGGTYQMMVPPAFPEADAPTLAWLALDASALEVASRLRTQLAVSAVRPEQPQWRYPRTLFPFSGVLPMQALGRWLDRAIFLVCRILSLRRRLPYQGLRLPPLTEAAEGGVADGEPQQRTARQRLQNVSKATLHSVREPSDARSITTLPALPAQFSEGTVISRLKQVDARVQGGDVTYRRVPAGTKFTTGLHSGPGSALKRVVLARTPGNKPPDAPLLLKDFEHLRTVLQALREEQAQVTERPINNPDGNEGRFRDWFKADGQRYGCLVAEIILQGRYFYILDKENLTGQYGPLILARRQGDGQATDAVLDALMTTRAKGRRWPKEAQGWTLWPVSHTFTSPARFAKSLLKRMEQAQPGGATL